MGRTGNQRTAGGGVLLTQGLIVSLARNPPTAQILISILFKLLLNSAKPGSKSFLLRRHQPDWWFNHDASSQADFNGTPTSKTDIAISSLTDAWQFNESTSALSLDKASSNKPNKHKHTNTNPRSRIVTPQLRQFAARSVQCSPPASLAAHWRN